MRETKATKVHVNDKLKALKEVKKNSNTLWNYLPKNSNKNVYQFNWNRKCTKIYLNVLAIYSQLYLQ